MDNQDPPPERTRQPYSRSPFKGLKSRLPIVPLRARVALLVCIAIGLFAAIVLSYSNEGLGLAALLAMVVAGFVTAGDLTRRDRR